ncbi:MAG: VWA domain-containing protein [Candidatus Eremiobacteraeota bacterium]|nr:VWA domain-containing protein [Candidatus Eremiobacteraeota bacterium]
MNLARPGWFVGALFLCGLLIFAYRWAERRRQVQALGYSNFEFALAALQAPRSPVTALATAFAIGAAALALAVGGPHFTASVPIRNATVVLCIDTSGSMRAHDLVPSRWEAARSAARAFVDAVPQDTRIGIVTFASGALVVAPPTDDRDAVREALDRIPPPNGATAIGDALDTAAAQLPPAGSRTVVLLTDGVNNRGSDPLESSRTIGERGVKIWTVGIGSTGSGEIIPGTNELADLDETALQAIAQNGGGRYAQVADANALVGTFRRLAAETVWEKKRVDGSLPFALGGGVLIAVAFVTALGLGRLP